jgi:hypothetical protein
MPRFRAFLIENRYSRFAMKDYCIVARHFLTCLERKAVTVNAVTPEDVDGYRRKRLRQYRKQHRREPRNLNDWHWHLKSPIHALLRLAQGQWPPRKTIDSRLDCFRKALRQVEHTAGTVRHYMQVARRFLIYLNQRSILAEAVRLREFRDSSTSSYAPSAGTKVGCQPNSYSGDVG